MVGSGKKDPIRPNYLVIALEDNSSIILETGQNWYDNASDCRKKCANTAKTDKWLKLKVIEITTFTLFKSQWYLLGHHMSGD